MASELGQKIGRQHIDYGYDGNQNGDRHDGRVYRLKDRQPSRVLQDKVYSQLSSLSALSKVANLGCGDGNLEAHTPPWRQYCFYSIDQDPEAIDTLGRVFKSQGRVLDKALVGDITALDSHPSLAGITFDAAVSWRVVHGLPKELQEPFFKSIHDKLRPGAHFYVSVLSDEDWKRHELETKGQYVPGQVNECVEVMRFAEHEIDKVSWPLYFFSKDRLDRLANDTGFSRSGEIITFQESTGFPHLASDGVDKHGFITYYFADLQKTGDVVYDSNLKRLNL